MTVLISTQRVCKYVLMPYYLFSSFKLIMYSFAWVISVPFVCSNWFFRFWISNSFCWYCCLPLSRIDSNCFILLSSVMSYLGVRLQTSSVIAVAVAVWVNAGYFLCSMFLKFFFNWTSYKTVACACPNLQCTEGLSSSRSYQ